MEFKPWFDVATPHEDIRQGRLSEAVFAADLWAVVQGTAPAVYLDPEAFFAKTYLTQGLTNVLKKVARALSGDADAGDRILTLQTAFGGGKTHILIALWHLAKHVETLRRSPACEDLRRALDGLPQQVKSVAVFTNKTCDAIQGRQTPEGVHTRTLWGELALQLGGVDLYRKIEANDQARTVPQGLFAELLERIAPCLILLDEVADYCVGASAVEVGATTLADQTISFAQQLTEAVQQTKGVAVVATLPASHLEVASSEKGQEILERLEKRFGRMSADIKPVADEEIFEVVRRRLFESIGDPAEHAKVANAYMKMYEQHKSDVPPEATRGTYKQRILAAYPFHPMLIDAFYLRWGSHHDFQRTRGILRVLASIVGDLWQRRHTETQSQPLIQPCHLRWTIDALHAQLTRLWGAAYESVVAADVIGEKANAVLLDEERGGDYTAEKIAQGLAAAILLGSFGGEGERVGFSTKDLRLAVGRPTLNWGYTDGALMLLDERSFYLHTGSAGSLGKRYWFGTKPRLTKLIVQYRGQFASENFDAEILELLQSDVQRSHRGLATWRVLVNPSSDLPEQRSLTLLIMPPECAYSEENGQGRLMTSDVEQRLLDLSLKCGRRDRLYRNTLLFLLPSPRGLSRLRAALREAAALEALAR
ncbi:MAG: ATP-binding protein, partial [Acidobacteria bacterium]